MKLVTGFGFVTFSSDDNAAASGMNRQELGGRILKVNAKPQGGGGGYSRGGASCGGGGHGY